MAEKQNKPVAEIDEKDYKKADFQKMFDRLNSSDEDGNPEDSTNDKAMA